MTPKRYQIFDSLRGFFLFLALLEHFGFLMNHIIVGYYEPHYFGSINLPINPLQGLLPTDGFLSWLMKFFGAWVSQIYLSLATLNLGLKYKELDQKRFRRNTIRFSFLFVLFTLEKFIIGRNIGEILSPNPLQNWMIVLIFLNCSLYYLKDIKTYIISSILGIVHFILPIDSFFRSLEVSLQQIHLEFSLEVRPDIFLISGLIGLIFGIALEKLESKKLKILAALSFIIIVIVNFFTPEYPIDRSNILLYEYDWSYNFLGSISIWSTIVFICSLACLLELKNKLTRWPLFNQIGKDSLWFFVFHRIFFIYLFIPFRLFITRWELFSSIENSWVNDFSAVAIYCLLFYGFKSIYKNSYR